MKIAKAKPALPPKAAADALGQKYTDANEACKTYAAEKEQASEQIKQLARDYAPEGKERLIEGDSFIVGFQTTANSKTVSLELARKVLPVHILRQCLTEAIDPYLVEKLVNEGKITAAQLLKMTVVSRIGGDRVVVKHKTT